MEKVDLPIRPVSFPVVQSALPGRAQSPERRPSILRRFLLLHLDRVKQRNHSPHQFSDGDRLAMLRVARQ